MTLYNITFDPHFDSFCFV